MAKLRSIYLACAFTAAQAGLAGAADLGPYAPPIVEVPAPVPVAACANWYLRGYTGMNTQEIDTFTNSTIEAGAFSIENHGIESAPLWGVGLGYDTCNYLRFDVTGEYRGRATFHGFDRYQGGDNFPGGSNEYTATFSEWLTLFNAYIDLGNFHGLKPYVGAGLGAAHIKIDDYTDINTPNAGAAFGHGNSDWNFAWALHGGVAFDVTPNLTLDLAYRYVDLGDISAGTSTAYDDSSTIDALEFKDLQSHDVMLGVRYKFGGSSPCCATVTPFK